MTSKPPITSEMVSDQWVADCREAMSVREGVPIRASGTVAGIEVWAVNRGRWQPLVLPGSGTLFCDCDERNKVLARLNAKAAS